MTRTTVELADTGRGKKPINFPLTHDKTVQKMSGADFVSAVFFYCAFKARIKFIFSKEKKNGMAYGDEKVN